MASKRCVLGIDPGLNITGYGVLGIAPGRPVLLEAGVVRGGDAKRPMAARLSDLYDGVAEIIDAFKPEAVAIEQLYSHYERPRTAILMGHARGVITLAAGRNGVQVVDYGATQVKKLLTGSGRAPKEQMQRAIQLELGLETLPEPADVADALAIAICHCHTLRTEHLSGLRRA